MRVYKAFRVGRDGEPRFLFHANQGSSRVLLDQTIQADSNLVGDGGILYYSGFHVFANKQAIKDWQKRVTKRYVVVPVQISGSIRPKWSNANILLASHLRVSSRTWKRALKHHNGVK